MVVVYNFGMRDSMVAHCTSLRPWNVSHTSHHSKTQPGESDRRPTVQLTQMILPKSGIPKLPPYPCNVFSSRPQKTDCLCRTRKNVKGAALRHASAS